MKYIDYEFSLACLLAYWTDKEINKEEYNILYSQFTSYINSNKKINISSSFFIDKLDKRLCFHQYLKWILKNLSEMVVTIKGEKGIDEFKALKNVTSLLINNYKKILLKGIQDEDYPETRPLDFYEPDKNKHIEFLKSKFLQKVISADGKISKEENDLMGHISNEFKEGFFKNLFK